ncbi:MAG: hypothetical protein JW908_09560 [Anaerolineales bacterium]|nr:hypothetical protein [Anaerolineales bacterium]
MKKSMPFFSIIFALVLTLFLVATIKNASYAADDNQGYVIIQSDPSQRYIREITFSSTINGLQALELVGAQVVTTTSGSSVLVCAIDGVGCPSDDCFCDTAYWGYSYWDGSAWQDYMVGADSSTLSDGAVEGWKWGEWGSASIPTATHLMAANDALDYLLTIQNSDGGYTGTSSSVETLLSIGSNKLTAANWQKPGNPSSLEDFLLPNSVDYSGDGAPEAGKLAISSILASYTSPSGTLTPSDYYSATTGIYAEGAGYQSWAMLGVSMLGETIPDKAVSYLKSLQKSDGSFEWYPGWGSDTNSTAMSIQALIASGESIISPPVIRGLNYLKSTQNTDGGFPYDPISPWGTDSDANSTAYVIQAIIAAEQDPCAFPWVESGGDPFDFLMSLQLPDGSFEWQSGFGVNILATQQAIPALLHNAYTKATNTQILSSYLPLLLLTDPE